MEYGIRYEGLAELARALRETDRALLKELKEDLGKVGDVVRDDARHKFEDISLQTAAGFETRVRAGGDASALVVVAQRLRKTTGKRPDYGATQMRHALLPARAEKQEDAVRILEDGAIKLLHDHGF